MFNNSSKTSEYFLLFIIISIAIYYRLNGLGLWGFTSADEYYMAKSVKQILKFGLPEYETGGYYTRGILYQYLSALLVWLGIKDVFALRFVSVLANIAAIPAVYLLGKKIGGIKTAFPALVLFLFSSWEVEYARFSRYYTLFQAIFLWHLFLIYLVVTEKKIYLYKWALLLTFLSVFVYEGSIFLVVINFFPFLIEKDYIDYKKFIAPSIITILVFFLIKINFRQLGVSNQLPNDVIIPPPVNPGMIFLPKFLIFTNLSLIWIIGFIFFMLIGFLLFNKTRKLQNDNRLETFLYLTLFLLILFNQIGLSFLLLLVFYLFGLLKSNFNTKKIIHLGLFSLIAVGFYSIFMYFTDNWVSLYRGEHAFSMKRIFWNLFNYPNIYEQVFLPWFKPLPILTLFVFGIIGLYLVKIIFKDLNGARRSESINYYFVISSLIVLTIGVSLIVTPYKVGRYTYFIHPLILIIFSYSLLKLIPQKIQKYENIIIALLILSLMFLSRDYQVKHFMNIDKSEEHFKVDYPKAQATMYYLREDYKSVADFVNENMSKNDFVFITVAPAEYYLKKVDYYYRDYRDIEFTIRSRERGKKELWTNANLVYTEERLLELLEKYNSNDETLWFITYSPKRLYARGIIKDLAEKYIDNIVYKNINNTIVVYKF